MQCRKVILPDGKVMFIAAEDGYDWPPLTAEEEERLEQHYEREDQEMKAWLKEEKAKEAAEQRSNLAYGTFVAKIPRWARWLLFLPIALLSAFILPVIAAIFGGFNTAGTNASFVGNIISMAVFGWSFVYVAAYIAPRKQYAVAIVMASILATGSLLLTVLLLLNGRDGVLKIMDVIYLIIGVVSGILSATIVAKQA